MLVDVSAELLEQIVNKRLREDFEAIHTQFVFRKVRTTVNVIQKVEEIALEGSKNKNSLW